MRKVFDIIDAGAQPGYRKLQFSFHQCNICFAEIVWRDTQHQILFKRLDDIITEPFDRSILTRLQHDAGHRFSLEETGMAGLNYPGTEAPFKPTANSFSRAK